MSANLLHSGAWTVFLDLACNCYRIANTMDLTEIPVDVCYFLRTSSDFTDEVSFCLWSWGSESNKNVYFAASPFLISNKSSRSPGKHCPDIKFNKSDKIFWTSFQYPGHYWSRIPVVFWYTYCYVRIKVLHLAGTIDEKSVELPVLNAQ